MNEKLKSEDEEMPCPRCKKLHARGQYIQRHDHQKPGRGIPVGPADVSCGCGALLAHTVPYFAVDRYGWHWRIL